jgi:hypothetical protein
MRWFSTISTQTFIKMTAGSDALGFREECLLLQLKCDLIGGQDYAYSFRNARNHEDAAQRLQRFVHWRQPFTVDLPC